MNEQLVLIASNCSFRSELEGRAFRLVSWPAPELQLPENSAALDEAIANLYGYDWITFVREESVRFFLERLEFRGHNASDLDPLRVCALGEATSVDLEQAQIHVDVIATQLTAAAIATELKIYAGADGLDRLNVLIPQAAIGRDYLKPTIEEAGARVDVAAAYQTVKAEDLTRLAGLQSMLSTGSVDAVVFADAQDVYQLASVFDTNDLRPLLRSTRVLTIDDNTLNAAVGFGVSDPIRFSPFAGITIAETLTKIGS